VTTLSSSCLRSEILNHILTSVLQTFISVFSPLSPENGRSVDVGAGRVQRGLNLLRDPFFVLPSQLSLPSRCLLLPSTSKPRFSPTSQPSPLPPSASPTMLEALRSWGHASKLSRTSFSDRMVSELFSSTFGSFVADVLLCFSV